MPAVAPSDHIVHLSEHDWVHFATSVAAEQNKIKNTN